MKIAERYDIDTNLEGIAMADLVEKNNIEDILSKYGMYCAGCPVGLGEDVIEAARVHGLNKNQAQNLKKIKREFHGFFGKRSIQKSEIFLCLKIVDFQHFPGYGKSLISLDT